MSSVVHIVDYGVGNLHSVARAIEQAGGEAKLSSSPLEIARAERILLPGVGAYGPCIESLRKAGLVEPVIAFAATGRPFLGICVGMQLLFGHSLEFGRHEGLALIPGQVEPIPAEDAAGTRKVPHIGWSPLLMPTARSDWGDTLLEDATPEVTSCYFVHSFNCAPSDPRYRLADANYGGFKICAAVQRDNITGFQCHPEKSGPAGIKILQRFLTN